MIECDWGRHFSDAFSPENDPDEAKFSTDLFANDRYSWRLGPYVRARTVCQYERGVRTSIQQTSEIPRYLRLRCVWSRVISALTRRHVIDPFSHGARARYTTIAKINCPRSDIPCIYVLERNVVKGRVGVPLLISQERRSSSAG